MKDPNLFLEIRIKKDFNLFTKVSFMDSQLRIFMINVMINHPQYALFCQIMGRYLEDTLLKNGHHQIGILMMRMQLSSH